MQDLFHQQYHIQSRSSFAADSAAFVNYMLNKQKDKNKQPQKKSIPKDIHIHLAFVKKLQGCTHFVACEILEWKRQVVLTPELLTPEKWSPWRHLDPK